MGEIKEIPFVPLEQRPPMSYDPYNPFQVEAILTHFNGIGSGTRSSAGAGGVINSVDDRERAEMEMNSILEEALLCNECKDLPITLKTMEGDIAHGRYDFRADPPFSASATNIIEDEDEDIAPDEISTPTARWQPGYNRFQTKMQRERYLEKVQECLDHARAYGIVENSDLVDNTHSDESDDMPLDVQFAFYSVDFHINRHSLARRSCFNLCRSKREMDELALWRKEVQFVDRVLFNSERSDPASPASSSCPAAAAVLVPASSRIGGPEAENEPSPTTTATTIRPLMNDTQQIALLHHIRSINNNNNNNNEKTPHPYSSHRKHVRAVRTRFKTIMRERGAQRAEGLLTAHYEALEQFLLWQQRQQQDDKKQQLLEEHMHMHVHTHTHTQPSGLKIKLRVGTTGQDQEKKPRPAAGTGGLKIRLRVKQDQGQNENENETENQNQNQAKEQKSKRKLKLKLK